MLPTIFSPLVGACAYAALVLAFVLIIPHTALGRKHYDSEPYAGAPYFDMHSKGHVAGCTAAAFFASLLGAHVVAVVIITTLGGAGYELTNSARFTKNSTGDVVCDFAGGIIGAVLGALVFGASVLFR